MLAIMCYARRTGTLAIMCYLFKRLAHLPLCVTGMLAIICYILIRGWYICHYVFHKD